VARSTFTRGWLPEITIAPGAHRRIDIEQGRRRVEVFAAGAPSRTIDVTATDSRGIHLVPARDDQCWVQVSVYGLYREPGDDRPPDPPTIHQRYRSSEPIYLLPGYFALDDLAELPQTTSGTVGMYVMHPIACDALYLPDSQLIERFGYEHERQ
jgi:hypothetical protein